MSEEPAGKPPQTGGKFSREIAAKEARKLKAQRRPPRSVLMGFGIFGLIGWSIVVPTLIGAAVGHWLDTHHPSSRSWTLALLIAGLVLGCLNAWRWIDTEQKNLRDEEEKK